MAASSSLSLCKFLFLSSSSQAKSHQKTSISFPVSPPSLVSINTSKPITRKGLIGPIGSCNVEVVVDEDEPEEVVASKFMRKVLRAGILQELRRRRRFENSQDKRKRKAREASKRRAARRGKFDANGDESSVSKKKEWYDFDGDNWELLPAEGELPYGI